jgi:pyruvate kinase
MIRESAPSELNEVLTTTEELILSDDSLDMQRATDLLATLRNLYSEIKEKGNARYAKWTASIERESFRFSANNLAQYLALREHDLRQVQTALMPWGLSSLGRSEARVQPNLEAVIATLETICRVERTTAHPTLDAFFRGDQLLEQNTTLLFGSARGDRHIRIMVTMPADAAKKYELVRDLLAEGMNCMRINCAHEDESDWLAMIENLRRAEKELGLSCKVLMDLGGPKVRTCEIISPLPDARLYPGEKLLLTNSVPKPNPEFLFQARCSLPEIFTQIKEGVEVWIDDGKVSCIVTKVFPNRVELKVLKAGPKGEKLKSDKGINFPNMQLLLSPLTQKDYRDLDFIVEHANIVGYSFVQEATDIRLLQDAIEERTKDRAREIAIVAKIETQRAVHNLPELVVAAAGKQPFGVMIARGDLAVEIGYQRLAEIQEEILWLCEAAHIPVVWATQVLENLVNTGTPSRAEMTDAAMSERAECVMLNKGPFVVQAVKILDDVLIRMQAHQLKKTPQLRALGVWREE